MPAKGQRRRKYDVEQVREAAKISYSIRQLMLNLGLSATGGGYHVIKKFIEANNIDISHFNGKGWSKGKTFGPARPIEDYLENKAGIGSHALKLKLIASGIFEHKCYRCGLSEWLGEKIPLELEHINGDHYDNTLSNLTLLCPNCHAFTPTYRGKKLKKDQNIAKDKKVQPKPTQKEITYPDGSFCPIHLPKICEQCKELFKPKYKEQRYCGYACSQSADRRFEISKEELEKLVWEMPTTKIAIMFGVSDNAVGKRCKMFGIEKPPRGYWAKVYYGKT